MLYHPTIVPSMYSTLLLDFLSMNCVMGHSILNFKVFFQIFEHDENVLVLKAIHGKKSQTISKKMKILRVFLVKMSQCAFERDPEVLQREGHLQTQ